jgi:hypothetical protein
VTWSLTEELLVRAQSKLEKAEVALQQAPLNMWLQLAVQFEHDKVEAFRRRLKKSQAT